MNEYTDYLVNQMWNKGNVKTQNTQVKALK